MDKSLLDKVSSQLQRLAKNLEKFNLAEYMEMLNNPRRYVMINFVGGLFRGLGMGCWLYHSRRHCADAVATADT